MAVDTLGHLLALHVTPANEQERDQVDALCQAMQQATGKGVRIKHMLTDNGSAFRSKALRAACTQHSIVQKFTRTYLLQTNDKAERFIQSALREWAYGWTYQNSAQRTQALLSWQHHYN